VRAFVCLTRVAEKPGFNLNPSDLDISKTKYLHTHIIFFCNMHCAIILAVEEAMQASSTLPMRGGEDNDWGR
jgi:hypothetical protein